MAHVAASEALKKEVPRYASIDEVLGDSRGRFFGAGFRQVRQNILDVRIDARAKTVHASTHIVYPPTWSKKNRALQPHLSSIDAFMVGSQLCEMYLREAYGIGARASRQMWIRRCVLKAGNVPTLELEAVPALCTLLKTERSEDSLCGYLSSFTGRIGSMGVEFVIDHPLIDAKDGVTVQYENATDLLGPPSQRYYGSAYTETSVLMQDVELDPVANSARSRLGLENPSQLQNLEGMGAAYVPFVSALNGIISVAQLSQALMYHYDGISREASNNLWMRKIVISSPLPVTPSRSMRVETWCNKTSLLPIKDTLWRSSSFIVVLPGHYGEYSLAHQLPSDSQ
ncbi:AvrD family protein [Stigmatella erecta]|uniref:Avirulence D protein (AvrD) n=1 Tax=Stigmatella erecta TaxID=83460 RepID=A0A1I0EUZ7_9BACT|nr:AvrD family protein [Stigmatella erecta]SET49419.1 avirulence D protein (AvrD) [Stigmatella erecta]